MIAELGQEDDRIEVSCSNISANHIVRHILQKFAHKSGRRAWSRVNKFLDFLAYGRVFVAMGIKEYSFLS